MTKVVCACPRPAASRVRCAIARGRSGDKFCLCRCHDNVGALPRDPQDDVDTRPMCPVCGRDAEACRHGKDHDQ